MSVSARALAPWPSTVRDAVWLRDEVDSIWRHYFADVPRINSVDVSFRRPWMRRLGVISLSEDAQTTRIGLNSLLAHRDVPYCLPLITVAHELVHYGHGFGSPLPRRFSHPHRGGIVTTELRARGLADELDEYGRWIQQHWWSFYARHARPAPPPYR
jgi:hypothetical protein